MSIFLNDCFDIYIFVYWTNNLFTNFQDVALVYILSGTLVVSQKMAEGDSDVHMFTAYPGYLTLYLSQNLNLMLQL